MLIALILGAIAAIALFLIRLFLPASVGAKYDRTVLTIFRLMAVAGIATIAAIGLYAALTAA